MRSDIVADWVARSEWAGWKRIAMTGDASARRYERLCSPNGTTVILMDAPPETCGSQGRFVEIAAHLKMLGLAAPEVLACDEASGLLMLSDLGQVDFARHLRAKPSDEALLYSGAVDVLCKLQSSPPPVDLTRMTPDVGADMIGIAFEWAARDKSSDLAVEITFHVQQLLQQVDPMPSVLSLRDFHAENLIWRPQYAELDRIGLLDFQDAFVTHPTYDLASLVRDARRDVDSDLLTELLTQLAGDGAELTEFKQAFHVMAIQRNLRILGIFQRLARQDGKTGYLDLVPRVWQHLQTDLTAGGFTELARLVLRAFGQSEATS